VRFENDVDGRSGSAQDRCAPSGRPSGAGRWWATPRQDFPVLGDEFHDFTLAFMRCIAQGCLSPHLRAVGFQRQREMQDAEPLLL